MRRSKTISASYFDELYSADPDPWGFRTSAYEQEKYGATLAALGRTRYRSALEVGCSIGVFTRLLAPRCDRLVAIDASDVALTDARRACGDLAHVEFARRMIPAGWPVGPFDLVILSEVLYYLVDEDVRSTADLCRSTLQRGGELVLCHWLGETDYPLSGHAAAETFIDALGSERADVTTSLHPAFRLDRIMSSAATTNPVSSAQP